MRAQDTHDRLGAMTVCPVARRTKHATLGGALAWLALPALPLGDPPPFAAIEHVFLLLPFVLTPPLLALASAMLQGAHRRARMLQPLASAALLVSFVLPHGAIAGALALPWLALALVLAARGVPAALAIARPHRMRLSLAAAHVFLVLGGVWLLLARLGTGPAHLSGLEVFVAVVHFHFSGFALELLVAATALRLPPVLGGLHRRLAVAAVAGIPIIAAGKLLAIPTLVTIGVTTMILVTLTLAFVAAVIARGLPRGAARNLLLVSAVAIATAMVLATAYGIGHLVGAHWLGVGQMVPTHGLLNALGFVLCGTLAHLRIFASAR